MKKLKRFGIILLSMVMLIQMSAVYVFAEGQNTIIYTDDQVKEIVDELQKFDLFNMWVNEESFFGEETNITRAETAKTLVKFLGYEDMEAVGDAKFFDVPGYHEYAGAIGVVSSMGVMTGAGDGLFEPDGEVLKCEFVAALVRSLGYGWKAIADGGYPTGYITVAKQMGLLEGIGGSFTDPLTRAEMVKILKNALNVPVYEIVGVQGESVKLSVDENETFLTYFHNIYTGKGIVNSNRDVSLVKEFDVENNKILIGNTEVYVNTATDIYDYLGYEVEFFYRYNSAGDKNELITFTLTEDNNVKEFLWRNISDESDGGSIIAVDESGKESEFKINSSAIYLYNNEEIKKDIDEKIKTVNGTIKIIDNDDNRLYDIVSIKDCVYDRVVANSISRNRMLYGENNIYNFSDAEVIEVVADNSTAMSVDDLKVDDIIEVIKGTNGKVAKIVVLKSSVRAKMKTMWNDEKITTDDGTEYYFGRGLSASHKNDISTLSSINLVLNSANEIVWVTTGKASTSYGYLIKAATIEEAFDEDVKVKMLTVSGNVEFFDCAEKVKIDGVTVNENAVVSKLAAIKTEIDVASDGSVSQLITYGLNSDGEIATIGTAADPEGLTMNINYKYEGETGTFYREWSAGGSFKYKYPGSTTAPIFNVPLTNQETAPDNFFSVTRNAFDASSGNVKIEHYSESPDKFEPCAFVQYKEAGAQTTIKSNGLLLIEEVYEALDADDAPCIKVIGWNNKGKREWDVSAKTIPELDKGDVAAFSVDPSGAIIGIVKLYDYKTDTIYNGSPVTEDDDKLVMLHLYDVQEGSEYFKAYKADLSDGNVPSEDDLQIFSFLPYNRMGNNLFYFDTETEEIGAGTPPIMVSAKQDSKNYTRILLRDMRGYLMDAIIYY